MVESKCVVLQMIPHTLFIEWDWGALFTVLFTSRLLFTELFTRCFTVHKPLALFTSRCEVIVHIYDTVHVYGTVHIYGTIHTTIFFL